MTVPHTAAHCALSSCPSRTRRPSSCRRHRRRSHLPSARYMHILHSHACMHAHICMHKHACTYACITPVGQAACRATLPADQGFAGNECPVGCSLLKRKLAHSCARYDQDGEGCEARRAGPIQRGSKVCWYFGGSKPHRALDLATAPTLPLPFHPLPAVCRTATY